MPSKPTDRKPSAKHTVLEFFVLALIKTGFTTPYDLHREARISFGGAIPALRRLEKQRLVRHGRPGVRGKLEFELTAKGERALKSFWSGYLERPVSLDLDEVLRIAALVGAIAADNQTAARLLRQAADARVEAAEKRRGDSSPFFPKAGPGELYCWMRAVCDTQRLGAETRSLKEIAAKLQRRQSA